MIFALLLLYRRHFLWPRVITMFHEDKGTYNLSMLNKAWPRSDHCPTKYIHNQPNVLTKHVLPLIYDIGLSQQSETVGTLVEKEIFTSSTH